MKKKLVLSIVFILIMSLAITVKAATGSIELAADTDSVLRGGTFKVTVAAIGDGKVTGLESKLSYDKNKVILKETKAENNFTEIREEGKLNAGILSLQGTELSNTVTIFTLTFQALDNAPLGETTIKVEEAKVTTVDDSKTQNEVIVSDQSVTVQIKEETNANDPDPDPTPEPKKETPKDETKKDSGKKLPQTGAETTSLFIIAGLGLVSIVSYVSYKKYKNI